MKRRSYRPLFLLPAMLIVGAGQVHADSVLMGDTNGDGQVTVADVVAVTNKIHGNPPVSFVATAADVNGDGQITIADVVGITNIIHHGSVNAQSTITSWTEGNTDEEQEEEELTCD